MNRILGTAVKIAGSLAIAGGTILASTAPASAATPNQAYGAAATGPNTLAPVAVATPTNTPAVASNADIPGFLATGYILDRADVTSAFARVNSPVVNMTDIQATLSATYVASSCRVFGTFTLARSDIYNGSVVQVGDSTIPLPENPAPNTTIFIDGATITLNMQSTTLGVTTVTALNIVDGAQTLSLGVTQCNGLLA
jgi:hypothetical protein